MLAFRLSLFSYYGGQEHIHCERGCGEWGQCSHKYAKLGKDLRSPDR